MGIKYQAEVYYRFDNRQPAQLTGTVSLGYRIGGREDYTVTQQNPTKGQWMRLLCTEILCNDTSIGVIFKRLLGTNGSGIYAEHQGLNVDDFSLKEVGHAEHPDYNSQ